MSRRSMAAPIAGDAGGNETFDSDRAERRCARRTIGSLLAVLGAMSAASSAPAAAPVLEHLYPAGMGAGTNGTLALSGKFDPWPPGFWIEGSGVSFVATTNTGRVTVTVAPDAAPGPRWMRLFGAEGASEPRLFVVGSKPEMAETEPNDAFAAPQSVAGLPVTINGRLDKNGDVDGFAVDVPAGGWLEARLDAYVLMSRVDAVLRLVTPRGAPLAWNHDTFGLDPRLVWKAEEARTVVVQVFGFKYPADSSIQLTGGEGAVYRLPLAIHGESPEPRVPGPTVEKQTHTTFPVTVRGVVDGGPPEDRHRLRASKGDTFVVRVDAAASGEVWDARLRVEDSAGKTLVENDDAEGSSDPRLDWTVPADGEYAVVVGSRLGRGDSRNRYALTIARAVPDFRATVPATAFAVSAGATNTVKVTVSRSHGHDRELRVGFRDLPEGVSCESAKVPAGSGEVGLNLVAATNAAPVSREVGLWVESVEAKESRSVESDLISRGENNGVPQGYSRLLRSSIDRFWLTVLPDASAKKP
ncbi:MAG: PPC domain-containing protein [Verrucomicrobiales bacterium]|nr:PPC domain-containing protein [Verrucomicrobiales bacterium]